MKTILLVRHAKSSWADLSLPDHKRPLNARGRRDAPYMASIAQYREGTLDLLISSHAKRAYRTAKHFRSAFRMSKDNLWKDVRLYLATPQEIITVIREIPENYAKVAIFGHNPGTTDLANLISDDRIDNVPTCGVVKLQADIDQWCDWTVESTTMLDFYYPKLLNA